MASYILTADQQRLVEDNMDLVPYTIAKRFGSENAQDEDFLSTGYLALCKAAACFDPTSGHRFSTYACSCIINGIYTESRKKYAHNIYLKMSPVSLNQLTEGNDGDADELLSFIPDPTVNIEEQATSGIFYDQMIKHMPTFAKMEQEGLSVADLARRERKSKQAIYRRLEMEGRRARHLLGEASQGGCSVA